MKIKHIRLLVNLYDIITFSEKVRVFLYQPRNLKMRRVIQALFLAMMLSSCVSRSEKVSRVANPVITPERSLIQCDTLPEGYVLFCPVASHPRLSSSLQVMENRTYLEKRVFDHDAFFEDAQMRSCSPISCQGYVFVQETCYSRPNHDHLGSSFIVGRFPEERSEVGDVMYRESCRRLLEGELERANGVRKQLATSGELGR